MPKRKVRICEAIKIFRGGYRLLTRCKWLWRHPSETLLNYNATSVSCSPPLIPPKFSRHNVHFLCVKTNIFLFECDRRNAFDCERRCPFFGGGVRSLGLHAVKAQAAAMLCSSCPPSLPDLPRTNALFIAISPPNRPEVPPKIPPVPLLVILTEKRWHSRARFDKITYFLSLFAVPNGCDDPPLPPGGSRERGKKVPPPFLKDSRASFQIWAPCIEWEKEMGEWEGKNRAQALNLWLHGSTWLG